MSEYNKPLPKPTPWSKPFWDGCKRHELLIQKCADCKKFVFYPKLFCPNCLSPKLEWIKASGNGKIYTYAVVYSYAPTEFSEDLPYIVAVVELDEGVRLMSNIVDCSPEAVRCDMRVVAHFQDISGEYTLPRFKLVPGA